MEEWADPGLLKEVRKYGKFDANACLNCGGYTITCALSLDGTIVSPRMAIEYVGTGLKKRLLTILAPWLCYYCGDCTTSCPRQAEPGETMTSLRRYLTANYIWTGLERKLNVSNLWEFDAIFLFAGIEILAWVILSELRLSTTFDGMSISDMAPVNIDYQKNIELSY